MKRRTPCRPDSKRVGKEDDCSPVLKRAKKKCDFHVHFYHNLSDNEIELLRHNLLEWFSRCRRKLPWRGDLPPYTATKATREASSEQKGKGLLKWIVKKEKYNAKEAIASNLHDTPSYNLNPLQNLSTKMMDLGQLQRSNISDQNAFLEVKNKVSSYGIWISEVMLQQTQVAVVIPYWLNWMSKWPTMRHLASAEQNEVAEVWAGLGYYSRAYRLLNSAKQLALKQLTPNEEKQFEGRPRTETKNIEEYTVSLRSNDIIEFEKKNGNNLQTVKEIELPATLEDLLKLPGIGEYTAGAILSIAHNIPVAAVDGNVIRVFSRVAAIASASDSPQLLKFIKEFASKCVDPVKPGEFNQALMDLGASICTPIDPKCELCPINSVCKTYKEVEFNRKEQERYESQIAKNKSALNDTSRVNHPSTKISSHLSANTELTRDPRLQHIIAERDLEDDHICLRKRRCDLCDISCQSAAERADDYPLSKTLLRPPKLTKLNALILYIKNNDIQLESQTQLEGSLKPNRKGSNGFIEILLIKRSDTGLLANEWGPLIIEGGRTNIENELAILKLRRTDSLEKASKEDYQVAIGTIKHVFSHVIHEVSVFATAACKMCAAADTSLTEFPTDMQRWVSLEVGHSQHTNLKKLNFTSKYMKKIFTPFLQRMKQF